MHQLVIVLSDFYVSQEAPERDLPAGVVLPGLQQATRFATRTGVSRGWRSWLSRWLTGREGEAPATVAIAGASITSAAAARTTSSSEPPADARPTVALMATPVNLVAGMTSLHLDRRSILRLDAHDQAALAADFQRVFHDSGFHLQPLAAGDFAMLGPPMPIADSPEPARLLGASMADTHIAGAMNPALLRLGAEIEMWLHDHTVNDSRRRRGEQPVTALWLWGGGPVPTGAAADGPATPNRASAVPPQSDIALARDSYVDGLWASACNEKVFPLPQQLEDVFGYPHAQRALLVIEIGLMLQSNPSWTFFEALAHIDRTFVTPAIEALSHGRYERLVILANDHEWTLRARDRWKIWRRTPPGLSGLQ
ncbi:MAG: hypothetical protein JSR66_30895 [Proteobacteria bacterium]|nr:hypothetical protein [Pseudomonadota bacterium]